MPCTKSNKYFTIHYIFFTSSASTTTSTLSSPICYHNRHLNHIKFSGKLSYPISTTTNNDQHLNTATRQCVAWCNNYVVATHKDKRYKTGLVYAGQCFCSKSKHRFNGARAACNENGFKLRCDWSKTTCQAFTYTVADLGSGIQEIDFSGGKKEKQLNAVTQMEFTFPDILVKG